MCRKFLLTIATKKTALWIEYFWKFRAVQLCMSHVQMGLVFPEQLLCLPRCSRNFRVSFHFMFQLSQKFESLFFCKICCIRIFQCLLFSILIWWLLAFFFVVYLCRSQLSLSTTLYPGPTYLNILITMLLR